MNRSTLRRAASFATLVLAAACGGDEFDARAPDVPFIDQYYPAGKDAKYDGTENCGPALLAGIAKARGQTGGLTDAALINRLGAIAGTAADGTSGHGMIRGLNSLGMQTDANQGANLVWVNDQLASVHDVIAQGDFYSVPGRENPRLKAGHYIAVTGVSNGWSRYKVTDPASRAVTSLTAAQLAHFISSVPGGGFTIGTR